MSISFDNAIATLKNMFPEWDEDTLSTLLVANNYHVERTIETILSMSGDPNVSSPNDPPASPPASSPAGGAAPSPPRPSPQPQSPPKTRPAPQPLSTQPFAAPSSAKRRRGVQCDLPDDFLRPPGWQSTTIIADEELALMLQNELFQREARAMLGDDFDFASMNRRSVSRSAAEGGGGGAAAAAAQANSNNANANGNSADLGIMKALSSMGSATKRSLSLMAQRFSSGGAAGGNAHANTNAPGGANAPTRRYSRGETGTGREFRPLVESDQVDDDGEDTEVISFDSQGTRSHHVLQGDSENPLLHHQSYSGSVTVNKKAN